MSGASEVWAESGALEVSAVSVVSVVLEASAVLVGSAVGGVGGVGGAGGVGKLSAGWCWGSAAGGAGGPSGSRVKRRCRRRVSNWQPAHSIEAPTQIAPPRTDGAIPCAASSRQASAR